MVVFWFRRDLRLADNAGLYHALKSGKEVLPIFIFDTNILDDLEDKTDARVSFIHETLTDIHENLKEFNSSLLIKNGAPVAVWEDLLNQYSIEAVYTNSDHEPYALDRDKKIEGLLAEYNVDFYTFKDHVIFEKDEVLKDDGTPYTVFTPYSKKWKKKLDTRVQSTPNGDLSYYFKSYPTLNYAEAFFSTKPYPIPSLEDIDFKRTEIEFPPREVPTSKIKKYGERRNFPAVDGTSKLGIHYRFGTISIREKARKSLGVSETYLNELIWRDFYSMILAHFPHVVGQPFRAKYDAIQWRDSDEDFESWKAGKTGYPLVDAGMRELMTTGYMHNRVRMVVASFLTKHLLIDWRRGEAWFAEKLLDFDLASNNGGWQWAAGCGTDAAPYFRIFNPTSQQTKFDKEFKYVKHWVPEFGTPDYPQPIVEHKFARERCLERYKTDLEAYATK